MVEAPLGNLRCFGSEAFEQVSYLDKDIFTDVAPNFKHELAIRVACFRQNI